MDKLKLKAGLVGLAMGLVIAIGGISYDGPCLRDIKIFPRENNSAIMRIYKFGSDGIYLPDPKNKNNYNITLKQHLEGIANEADRKIEEAAIKKVVGWYNE